MRPYNIYCTHVRGETNLLPDHLSRNPKNTQEAQEFKTPAPTICNKSMSVIDVELNIKDRYVTQVAEGAKEDADYSYILQAVCDGTEPSDL